MATTKAAPHPIIKKASVPVIKATSNGGIPSPQALQQLLRALKAARDGDFSVRLPERKSTVSRRSEDGGGGGSLRIG